MRRILLIVIFVVVGAVVAFVLNRRADPKHEPADADARQAPGDPSMSSRVTREGVPPDDTADGGVEDGEGGAFYFDLADLDFEAIRAETPNSLYWLMAAPTDDPAVLEARARTRDERNRQYGRVVSNTATDEEIRDYYAYRRKLSEDYIEVVQLILEEHGEELSERDEGLFDLAVSMHSARLAEIPSKLNDALQRKQEYDQVRAEWQEQKRKEGGGAEP